MNKVAKFSMVTILVLGLASAAFADTLTFSSPGATPPPPGTATQGTAVGLLGPNTLTISNEPISLYTTTSGPCSTGCSITGGILTLTATGGTGGTATGYSFTSGTIQITGALSSTGSSLTLFTGNLGTSSISAPVLDSTTGLYSATFSTSINMAGIFLNSALGSFNGPVGATSIDSLISNPGSTTSGTVTGSTTAVHIPDGGITLMLLGGVLVGFETLRRKVRA